MTPCTTVETAKILVIEDSRPVRMSFVLAFEDEGYEVFDAPDGRTGLEQFAKHGPDLVLTDLRMPDIDGLEVISEIRKTSEVPIIVVSALGDSETKDACINAGANDYIVKGSGVDELIRHVARQLSTRDSSASPA